MKRNAKKRIWANLQELGTNICNQHNILYNFESHNVWRLSRNGLIEKNTFKIFNLVSNPDSRHSVIRHISLINKITKEISLNLIVSKKDMAELESLYNRYGKK